MSINSENQLKILSRYMNEFYIPPAEAVPAAAIPDGYVTSTELDEIKLEPGEGAYYSVAPAKIERPKFESVYKEVIRYQDLVRKYSTEFGVDENVIFAIISVESNGNADAEAAVTESQKKYPVFRAYGLMQLIPATAYRYIKGKKLTIPDSNTYGDLEFLKGAKTSKPFYPLSVGSVNKFYQELKNPEFNIKAGVAYYSEWLKKLGGDIAKAFSAYNAGPGYVLTAQKLFNKTPREWFDRLGEAEFKGKTARINENKPYIINNVALYLKYAKHRKGIA